MFLRLIKTDTSCLRICRDDYTLKVKYSAHGFEFSNTYIVSYPDLSPQSGCKLQLHGKIWVRDKHLSCFGALLNNYLHIMRTF